MSKDIPYKVERQQVWLAVHELAQVLLTAEDFTSLNQLTIMAGDMQRLEERLDA